jgi:hypothetical protein
MEFSLVFFLDYIHQRWGVQSCREIKLHVELRKQNVFEGPN